MYRLYTLAFIRKIKTKSGTYLAEVESYRDNGKVKQRVLRYIGKDVDGKVVRHIPSNQIGVTEVRRHADIAVLHHLAEELELIDVLGPRAAEILLFVYTQILERKSIRKLEEWLSPTDLLKILKIDAIGTKDLYYVLKLVDQIDFNALQQNLNSKWEALESNTEAVVLDITDTYFNGSRIDWKSRRGKDGVHVKLIQVALGVSFQYGLPLSHRIYEGNISNKHILQDMLTELIKLGY